MLCSKLHGQKGLKLILFSYQIFDSPGLILFSYEIDSLFISNPGTQVKGSIQRLVQERLVKLETTCYEVPPDPKPLNPLKMLRGDPES